MGAAAMARNNTVAQLKASEGFKRGRRARRAEDGERVPGGPVLHDRSGVRRADRDIAAGALHAEHRSDSDAVSEVEELGA